MSNDHDPYDDELAYDSAGNAYSFSLFPCSRESYQHQKPLVLGRPPVPQQNEYVVVVTEEIQESLPTAHPWTRALSSFLPRWTRE